MIRFSPAEVQIDLGEQLMAYLSQRSDLVPHPESHGKFGHRWYDRVPQLMAAMDHLKAAPHLVKLQTSDFLYNSIQNLTPHRFTNTR